MRHKATAVRNHPRKTKDLETYEYRGMLFAKMGRKADAEKDLATLKTLHQKLAAELEEFLKTGKEEDEYGIALLLQSKRLRVVKVFQEVWKPLSRKFRRMQTERYYIWRAH